MIKVTDGRCVDWFDSFEDVATYYWHPECKSLEELSDTLYHEAEGMAIPKFEEV